MAIQVAGRRASRPAGQKEAAALVIGALATMAQNSGVRTLNFTAANGKPLALAIIEDARFTEKHGETQLSPAKEEDNE